MIEDRYNQLLNSIDQGYCVIDVIFNDAGKAVDWRYLETNQQYINHGGLPDSAGQLVSVLYPGTEAYWFEFYGNVAVNGIPAHMENELKVPGKWFDIYAYKIGGNESRRVGVLFRDVTDRKQTETALKQNEQRFRSVLDNSIDVIYRVNIQTGQYDYVSPSAEMIMGDTLERYMAMSPDEALAMIHTDDLPAIQTAMALLRETGKEKVIYRQRNKNGEYRWLSNHMSLTKDSAGQPLYRYGNVRDITEAIQVEEKLRESEEKYRGLFNNLRGSFFVGEAIFDETGKPVDYIIVDANPEWVETTGLSREQIIGSKFHTIHPDTDIQKHENIEKVMLTGGPVQYESHHPDTGRWYLNYLYRAGHNLLCCMMLDITERKQTEEALQQANRNFTALFNNKTVGLYYGRTVFDENNQPSDFFVLDVNPTYEIMTGIPRNQIAGKNVTELSPKVSKDFINRHNTVAVTGEETRFEIQGPITDRWYDISVFSPQRGYFIAVFFNITERKRTEEALRESERKALILIEELEKADKNKNQFISVLSHELRNPLAVITAGLSLLEVSERKEQILKTKDIIKRQTGQLTKLVDDLLELTRFNHNKIMLKKEPVNLSDIVKNGVLDHMPKYKKKGLLLCTELPQEPVFMSADPVRMSQCIENLLQNALKFTPGTGEVVLSLETENGEAVISVRDNGMGISPDFLPQLFEPFTQEYVSLDRQNNDGLGLGLSITKGIAELHGGTIAAFSEGAGKGSLFTIRLPLTELTDDVQNPETVLKASRTYKILLIDDNENLTDVLCSVFGVMGHQAYAARNGTEGIAEAKKILPDIIFCDIGLPGLSGYEVAGILKADDELKSTFLIALTGYTGSDQVERTKAAGFDRHLAKPVDMALLEKILAEIQ